jgi:predicted AAA+ superfamily ATPase
MIQRVAKEKLIELASYFKVVSVIGPRQSGKTTLVRTVFPDKPYVSLENLDVRNFAETDPRGFLSTYEDGAIFDEVQRVPALFSYLQEIVDNTKDKGVFILTGSNNFLLQESITQSLAGRIGYLTLLPFSLAELKTKMSDAKLMLTGFYPPVHDQKIPFDLWCTNYVKTYLERDVRLIKSISDLSQFERFLKLLAGRAGQEFNATSFSVQLGVDYKTIQSWLSVLETSFVVYRLKPFYNNFNKTIIKRPKIYFYDTSIVCSLLGIKNEDHLEFHPLRGAIFENMVVTEYVKQFTNQNIDPPLYFWRDKTGREVDLIIDYEGKLTPLEIKSGQTIRPEFLKGIAYWMKLAKVPNGIVAYAGKDLQKHSNGIVIENWREIKVS